MGNYKIRYKANDSRRVLPDKVVSWLKDNNLKFNEKNVHTEFLEVVYQRETATTHIYVMFYFYSDGRIEVEKYDPLAMMHDDFTMEELKFFDEMNIDLTQDQADATKQQISDWV